MAELNEEEKKALQGQAREVFRQTADAQARAARVCGEAARASEELAAALPEGITVAAYHEHLRQSGDDQAIADYERLLVAVGDADSSAKVAQDEANVASAEADRVVAGMQAQGLLPRS